jgi:hypothetical protein
MYEGFTWKLANGDFVSPDEALSLRVALHGVIGRSNDPWYR